MSFDLATYAIGLVTGLVLPFAIRLLVWALQVTRK